MKLAQKMRAKVRFRIEFSHFLKLKDFVGVANAANPHQSRIVASSVFRRVREAPVRLRMKSLLFDQKPLGSSYDSEANSCIGVCSHRVFECDVAFLAVC
jgi:hypothetical protein